MIVQNFGNLEKYKRVAIFDRDNTLVQDSGYTYRVEDLKWVPGVISSLKWLTSKNIGLAVATNQSGINRGFFDESDVLKFHTKMNEELALYGVQIDMFVICPHLPESSDEICGCRKPKPGMVEFIKEHAIAANQIVLIGDRESDYLAAKNAQIDGFMVDEETSLDVLVKGVFES